MSIQHFVNIAVHACYTKENIKNILERGIQKSFYYHSFDENITLTSENAAQKVIEAFKSKAEYGPLVFIKLENDCNAIISFYESKDGFLEVHFGGFGSPIKRDFKEDVYAIDLDHYIRMALDLCKDYAIVKLETDSL